jgi:hypothetical protein
MELLNLLALKKVQGHEHGYTPVDSLIIAMAMDSLIQTILPGPIISRHVPFLTKK